MKIQITFLLLLLLAGSLQAATYVVTNAGDDPNQPTLRWAIDTANANPGVDSIIFSIGMQAPVTIQLATSLPKITDQVVIDGNTQPGTVASGNRILINGLTQQNTLQNPQLFVFFLTEDPVLGTIASGSVIQNMTILALDHVPASGPVIVGHQTFAFYLDKVDECHIRNNIVRDVDGNGMVLRDGANDNVIQGNIFGTDATLTGNHPVLAHITLGESQDGVRCDRNVFGGLGPGERNFFYNLPANNSNYYSVRMFYGIRNRISGNQFVNNGQALLHNILIAGYNSPSCPDMQECKEPPLPGMQAELVNSGLQVSGQCMNAAGGGAVGDTVEIFTSDANGHDAIDLLGIAVITNTNGTWSVILPSVGLSPGDSVVATTSDVNRNTSTFRAAEIVCENPLPVISGINGGMGFSIDFQAGIASCFSVQASDNEPVNFYAANLGNTLSGATFTATNNLTALVDGELCWTPAINQAGQSFCVILTAEDSLVCGLPVTQQFCINVIDTLPPCPNCISSFRPEEGKRYLVGAWAKEVNAPLTKTHFDRPEVYIDFPGFTTFGPFAPSGDIIDGWQRIEGEFTVPMGASEIQLRLVSTQGDVYFDDVRVLPFEAQMVNYVYDPLTMRLMAELDERHYATFYEYDEEGQLVRVKKETEKGIMTLQETRQNAAN